MGWLAFALILSVAVSIPVSVLSVRAASRLRAEAWRRIAEEARRPSPQGHWREIGIGALVTLGIGIAIYAFGIVYLTIAVLTGQLTGWPWAASTVALGLVVMIAANVVWQISRKRRRPGM